MKKLIPVILAFSGIMLYHLEKSKSERDQRDKILFSEEESDMRGRPRNLPREIEDYDFALLAHGEKDARVRIRLLGLFHIQKGKSYREVAEILQMEEAAPSRWVKRLAHGGLIALQEQAGRGRQRKLKIEKEPDFCECVEELRQQRRGGRARVQDIQILLTEKFDAHYALSSVYYVLHRAGMSWITARSVHPHADLEAQETFKKTLLLK